MGDSTLESEHQITARRICVTIGLASWPALLFIALLVADRHYFRWGLFLPLLLATLLVVTIAYPAAVAASLHVFYSGRPVLGVALLTLAFILRRLPAALMLLLFGPAPMGPVGGP